MGAPPDPNVASKDRRRRPSASAVVGQSLRRQPLTVPASTLAEYPSSTAIVTPPLLVSTSRPSPCHAGPSRSTDTPPLVVRPRTSPPTPARFTPPLFVSNSIRPSTSRT